MWKEIKKENVTYYTLPRWQEAGAEVIMTCRPGGSSLSPYEGLNLGLHVGDKRETVVENRRLLLSEAGLTEAAFVSCKQVHGKNIRYVDAADGGRGFTSYDSAIDDCDGMFTDAKQVLMATFYADCLPVAVFHPEKKLLGLAHAGWKGTYQNIGKTLIEAMQAYADFDPSDLWCALGAGIGLCCYEVDEAFYRRFTEAYPEAASWFVQKAGEKYHFDNVKANLALLTKAGVRQNNISVLGICTSCRNDLFYSYRKEEGKTGRHGLWGALI